MGQLTRRYDWVSSPLGTPNHWPVSLRAAVGIVLHSRFPMFLWWGADLIQFYNDAYRPSLGQLGKHPTALGQRGDACWPETWPVIKPLIDQVLAGGEATWSEDQLIPIYRNGRLEDVYWTFSYSAAYGDEGQINGVFVTCTETTQAVLARRAFERSQTAFQHAIAQAPVATALFRGPQFVIELANEQVLAYWGRSRMEVIDKPLFEALPEAAGQGFEELLTGVLMNGHRFVANELAVKIQRAGKLEQTYIDFVYEPYREIDGTISGVTVVCVEVTEQVLARQQLHQAQASLQSAMAVAQLGIWQVDLATNQVEVDERCREIFGFGAEEGLTLERIQQIIDPGYRSLATEALTTALREPTATAEYYLIQPSTKQQIWIRSISTLQQDADGSRYVKSVVQDLTGLKQAVTDIEGLNGQLNQTLSQLRDSEARYRLLSVDLEQQVQLRTQELTVSNADLLDLNGLLVRSNENLEKFAYIASHDLQEPLRKIQQFGDLLKTRYAATTGDELVYLERMQLAASRMSTLIRDLLSFSRIATRRDLITPVPLNEVVDQALTNLELVLAETNASVHVALLPTIPGDATQLGQLFQNLLSNALKFRRKDVSGDWVTPQIEIHGQLISPDELPALVKPARQVQTYYLIEISDNGIGFEEKYLDRIFQIFQRLHGKGEFTGTGIGLAICEKVVANHGGAITATSQVGQGTTFLIYLPLIGA
ncbi:hypothetical protein GCM10028773_64070 [Spirosoma koreense]